MRNLVTVVVTSVIFSIAIATFMPALAAENEAPNAMITYSYSVIGGQVTGGGWFTPDPEIPDERVHFSFGNRLLFDQRTGMKVYKESIDSLTVEGDTATMSGTARVDDVEYEFIIEVEDKGEPGWKKGDTYAITIPDLPYSASGSLVNEPGGGNIQVHDDAVEAPTTNQPIVFDASESYDIDGNIVEYEWDFGDDTSTQEGNIAEITHIYTDEGEYTVTLTVTDDVGATDVTTITVTIEGEGEGDEISGDVTLDEVSLSVPEDERWTIGDIIVITGSATLTNTGDATDVTVEICVDGNIIYQEDTALLPGVDAIPVSVEWLPMSSGAHVISLQVRERVGDEYYWIGPTNDLSSEIRVFIKKVK